MSFIADPKRHANPDECVFGLKLCAQARSIKSKNRSATLSVDATCMVEKTSNAEEIVRWKRKLESNKIRPYHEVGHYLAGYTLYAVNCESTAAQRIGGATGRHGAQRCGLYACENPATCFVDRAVSGVHGGLEIVLYVRSVVDTIIQTGDLPEKIERM